MAFNFLTGQPSGSLNQQAQQFTPGQRMQFQQFLSSQQNPQSTVANWATNPAMAGGSPQIAGVQQLGQMAGLGQQQMSPQMAQAQQIGQFAGLGSAPSYGQNPLSNQGANGFSLSDYLQRAQASGFNPQMAFGGLQMMLKGWGSHS